MPTPVFEDLPEKVNSLRAFAHYRSSVMNRNDVADRLDSTSPDGHLHCVDGQNEQLSASASLDSKIERSATPCAARFSTCVQIVVVRTSLHRNTIKTSSRLYRQSLPLSAE